IVEPEMAYPIACPYAAGREDRGHPFDPAPQLRIGPRQPVASQRRPVRIPGRPFGKPSAETHHMPGITTHDAISPLEAMWWSDSSRCDHAYPSCSSNWVSTSPCFLASGPFSISLARIFFEAPANFCITVSGNLWTVTAILFTPV